jgi:alanyl-tRNA synthetase
MRILVREFLTAQEMLGITDITFLPSMLYVTNDLYPETRRVWRKVQRYIREEEIRFQETLQKGMRKLEQHVKTKRGISGEEILKYEKKHGIPFVLLTYRLRQKGIHLSQKEYAAYQKAKDAFSSRISE